MRPLKTAEVPIIDGETLIQLRDHHIAIARIQMRLEVIANEDEAAQTARSTPSEKEKADLQTQIDSLERKVWTLTAASFARSATPWKCPS